MKLVKLFPSIISTITSYGPFHVDWTDPGRLPLVGRDAIDPDLIPIGCWPSTRRGGIEEGVVVRGPWSTTASCRSWRHRIGPVTLLGRAVIDDNDLALFLILGPLSSSDHRRIGLVEVLVVRVK